MQGSGETRELRARLIQLEDDITELKLEIAEKNTINDDLTKELDEAKVEIQRLRLQAYKARGGNSNEGRRRGSVKSVSSSSTSTADEAPIAAGPVRPADRGNSAHRRRSISTCGRDSNHRDNDNSPPTFSHASISNGLRSSLSSLAAEILPTSTVAPPVSSNRTERRRGSISNDSCSRRRADLNSDDGSVNSKQSVVSLEKRYEELQWRFNHTTHGGKTGRASNITCTNQRDQHAIASESARSVSGTQRMLRRLSSTGVSNSR